MKGFSKVRAWPGLCERLSGYGGRGDWRLRKQHEAQAGTGEVVKGMDWF